MTTVVTETPTVALKKLKSLNVDGLELAVIESNRRKALEVIVERDASLTLRTPVDASVERAMRFVRAKRDWIHRKLHDKHALGSVLVPKQFVEGEGFAYLGRSYRLSLTADAGNRVQLVRGRLRMPATLISNGPMLMRRWYTVTGHRWLKRRVRPWASRAGHPDVSVQVLDLGYRWGSARPTQRPPRINIHWATLQLPPTLIDYVIVHELAHLREANHTEQFWRIVRRLMPDYERHKADLAKSGPSIWLGAVAHD